MFTSLSMVLSALMTALQNLSVFISALLMQELMTRCEEIIPFNIILPDYKFDPFRKEAPEKYESYTDMEINKWITMRIEIKDAQAKLFINNNQQPSLIMNDLKHDADASGSIGFWVETGTEGFFKDLKITKQ